MNSTNVPSREDNPTIVVGQTIPTDKGLEMPPKTAKWGVSEKEVKESDRQGEIVISQVGNGELQKDGTLKRADGTSAKMVNPNAYQAVVNAKKQKEEMRQEADKKVQSRMESR